MLDIVGMNSFEAIASYSKQAEKAGVDIEIIDAVIKDAKSGDYPHLEAVLAEVLLNIKNIK